MLTVYLYSVHCSNEFNITVLHEFVKLHQFHGLDLVEALRCVCVCVCVCVAAFSVGVGVVDLNLRLWKLSNLMTVITS